MWLETLQRYTDGMNITSAGIPQPRSQDARPDRFLTPEEVREFQAAVTEETGEAMSYDEAADRLIELTALVQMLAVPHPDDPECG